MENYILDVQVRWSDLDPNVHLRHSVYYDWGAFSRVSFFQENQLTGEAMQGLKIGPILFREECVFRKEIRMGDKVSIDLTLLNARKDFSRWSIRHTIRKKEDVISAILTVEGAWLDVVKRKLAAPPVEVHPLFINMPKAAEFSWLD